MVNCEAVLGECIQCSPIFFVCPGGDKRLKPIGVSDTRERVCYMVNGGLLPKASVGDIGIYHQLRAFTSTQRLVDTLQSLNSLTNEETVVRVCLALEI